MMSSVGGGRAGEGGPQKFCMREGEGDPIIEKNCGCHHISKQFEAPYDCPQRKLEVGCIHECTKQRTKSKLTQGLSNKILFQMLQHFPEAEPHLNRRIEIHAT